METNEGCYCVELLLIRHSQGELIGTIIAHCKELIGAGGMFQASVILFTLVFSPFSLLQLRALTSRLKITQPLCTFAR